MGGDSPHLWHCHKCGGGGNALHFVKHALNLDDRPAFQWLHGQGFLPDDGNGRAAPQPENALEQLAAIRGWTAEALQALGAEAHGERVRFPMRNAKGEVIGQKEQRGDNRPIQTAGGEAKSRTRAGGKSGLFYPVPFPDAGVALIVEGEADCAAALSTGHKAVVGTAGCCPGRESGRPDLQRLLHGREVVLAPDPGEGGRQREYLGIGLREGV